MEVNKFEKIQTRLQAGQALLAVILVVVIALTVGLSVAVRTTTNTLTTSEEENSQRAFSAAEAGIERSIGTNPPELNNQPAAANTTYSTSVIQSSGASFLMNSGTIALKDEPVDLWLSTYPDFTSPWSGNLTINWGNANDVCTNSETTNTQAALEIILISGTKANPTVNTYTFDPCAARAGQNKFQSVSTGSYSISGKSFNYQVVIPIASGLYGRIIPLYAPTTIGVKKGDTDSNLPPQGSIISSVGTSGTTKRKIVSFRGYPKLPVELFPYIIFSPNP